jgi:signal transduction histidine kinase
LESGTDISGYGCSRDSGIEIIGKIPWGTHMAHLYSSKEDYFRVAVPYVQKGLLNNELCVWIFARNTDLDEVKNNISLHVRNVDMYLEKGQLMIMPHTDWYLGKDGFNEARVNWQWNTLIRHALDEGYQGLRAVADACWVKRGFFRAFSRYEQNIDRIISDLPFIAVCLYDINNVNQAEIRDIVKSHTYVLTRYEGKLILQSDLENTLEYDKLKTDFFTNMSHELKTPLNVILCAVQLLINQKKQQPSASRECEYLKIIQQNCFRLLRLVNNIIDLTRIDSDYFDIKLQNHDIVSLVKNTTMSVVEYAKNKNLDVIFETNCKSKIIACDPGQFERIVLNLLSNSIKFTRDGGSIKVSVTECGETVKISVKDNGIGIPLCKQKLIFDRFRQADSSLRKQYEGSGMGLSIVKALVDKHNGKIALKSKPGKGSEFIIELPCRVLKDEAGVLNLSVDNGNHGYKEKTSIELSDI